MRQKYTNVQGLIETIRERKSQGETNREIATSLDLTLKQVQQLITRENRRERLLTQGCVLRPKGRPRKLLENEEAQRNHELAKLHWQQYGGISGHTDDLGCSDYRKGHWWTHHPQ